MSQDKLNYTFKPRLIGVAKQKSAQTIYSTSAPFYTPFLDNLWVGEYKALYLTYVTISSLL